MTKEPRSKEIYFLLLALGLSVSVFLNTGLFLAGVTQHSTAFAKAQATLYSGSFASRLLYAGILVPWLEELVFRGALYRILARFVRWEYALILSSLAFGIYHLNVPQGIYGFVLGCIFACCMKETGLLRLCGALHMAVNVLALILTESGFYEYVFSSVMRSVVLLVFSGLFAGVVVLLGFRNKESN